MDLDTGIFVFEILGVIAFAFSGAILAIRKCMDLLGVIVLAVTTAVGGGIIRDVILGINPPMAFTSSEQTAIACLVSVVIFCAVAYCQKKGIDSLFHKLDLYMTIFDAVGLAAFTVTGVSVAHGNSDGYNLFLYIFVGTLTGVGGGVLRDVMAGVMPSIFVRHVYALASVLGAAVCSLLWHVNSALAMVLGAGVVVMWSSPLFYRLSRSVRKNSSNRQEHSASSTPATTWGRWLKSSQNRSSTPPMAPPLGSRAPRNT